MVTKICQDGKRLKIPIIGSFQLQARSKTTKERNNMPKKSIIMLGLMMSICQTLPGTCDDCPPGEKPCGCSCWDHWTSGAAGANCWASFAGYHTENFCQIQCINDFKAQGRTDQPYSYSQYQYYQSCQQYFKGPANFKR